ncbi:TIGR04255 family protein [Curtobacterium sp. MCBD17_003]|uniref:TIGR04255 family protein n=1 Tax=Curtobacterium sp. MCBD17_003 TaxID=2175667 RepID=UPI000DA76802|nr:TIGR04255 family protein [Curtobacterium sp. MCBD17_003]WIE53441.1 TIGR04255 family protein [Curtobacterium sp. MCBD17_003]
MTLHFRNPPLLELVADLRWDVPSSPQPLAAIGPLGTVPVQVALNAQEPLLDEFRAACQELGFTYVERLVPVGMPLMPGQHLFRFRRTTDNLIVQAGPGVVSVHALPPYESWAGFSPEVKKVVAALTTVLRGYNNEFFREVSVRYLDAFGRRFLGEASPSDFAQQTLGFKLHLPGSVEDERDASSATQLAFTYSFSTRDALAVTIALSEGLINNEVSLIWDTAVRSGSAVASESEKVMEVFARAHDVIHAIFVDSTQSIRELMEPEGQDD